LSKSGATDTYRKLAAVPSEALTTPALLSQWERREKDKMAGT
jgi:hypothetical protein